MSEKRKPVDLGELRGVVSTVLATWSNWAIYSAVQKAEILSMLQALVTIELQREQAQKAEETQLNYRRLTTALEHQNSIPDA